MVLAACSAHDPIDLRAGNVLISSDFPPDDQGAIIAAVAEWRRACPSAELSVSIVPPATANVFPREYIEGAYGLHYTTHIEIELGHDTKRIAMHELGHALGTKEHPEHGIMSVDMEQTEITENDIRLVGCVD